VPSILNLGTAVFLPEEDARVSATDWAEADVEALAIATKEAGRRDEKEKRPATARALAVSEIERRR